MRQGEKSQRAKQRTGNRRPVVSAIVATDNAGALPATLGVQLTWDGVLQSASPLSLSTSGFHPGDVLTVAAQVASPVSGAGRHAWSLRVVISGHPDAVASGVTYVVSQDLSAFGSGWALAPVDRLV